MNTHITECGGRGPRHGFTLIELIIVVTMLAILAAGVVPVFNGTFRTVQSDHSIRDFAATVRYVQERAVTEGVEYRLYVNAQTNVYRLARLAVMEDEEKVFEPVAVLQDDWVQLPAQLRFRAPQAKKDRNTGEAYICFYPTGACDTAKIEIISPAGKASSVETNGCIGKLKVNM